MSLGFWPLGPVWPPRYLPSTGGPSQHGGILARGLARAHARVGKVAAASELVASAYIRVSPPSTRPHPLLARTRALPAHPTVCAFVCLFAAFLLLL